MVLFVPDRTVLQELELPFHWVKLDVKVPNRENC
jgi:hypothetical protein